MGSTYEPAFYVPLENRRPVGDTGLRICVPFLNWRESHIREALSSYSESQLVGLIQEIQQDLREANQLLEKYNPEKVEAILGELDNVREVVDDLTRELSGVETYVGYLEDSLERLRNL